MNQFPIDKFFKFRQEPIYILASKITYEEFFPKFDLKYEIWEEDGLGKIVGAAIELGDYEYFLKSAYEYVVPHTEVAFYVKAGCKEPWKATKNLVKLLKLEPADIKDVSEHYFNFKWKIVRVPKKAPEVTICNFENKEHAQRALENANKRYDDSFYISEVSFNQAKQ